MSALFLLASKTPSGSSIDPVTFITAVIGLVGVYLTVSALRSSRKKSTNEEYDRVSALANKLDREARKWRYAYDHLFAYTRRLLRWVNKNVEPLGIELPDDLAEIPPDPDVEPEEDR